MSEDHVKAKAKEPPSHMKIAGWLWVSGMAMVLAASVVWITLALIAGDYYSNAKAIRDAAPAGSDELSQLGTIQAVSAWVLPLGFVGLATFFVGFGFALNDILAKVRSPAEAMAAALAALALPDGDQ